MHRSQLKALVNWYKSENRKPLVLRGARQVGKSTMVRMFAEAAQLRLIEINLEQHTDLDRVFKSLDVSKILEALENRLRIDIASINTERVLLFLDEIQATPYALAALRYFYELRPNLAVIAAGSLLEICLSELPFSMPVGRIEYRFVGPLTFAEYLEARQEHWFLQKMANWNLSPWSDDLHSHGNKLYREFLLTGGMPGVVAAAKNTRSIQLQILNTYREDFAKYTRRKALLPVLQMMFDRLPRTIGRKVKLSEIAPQIRSEYAGSALNLLRDARIVNLTIHSDATAIPLASEARPDIMKSFWLDVGLWNAALGLERLTGEEAHAGPMAEQFIAQHLAFWTGDETPPQTFYWLRDGKKNNAEVDFVIQKDRAIIPVEVKSASTGALRSMLQFLARDTGNSPFGIKFADSRPKFHPIEYQVITPKGPKKISSHLLTLPHYMVCETKRIVKQALSLI